MMNMGENVNSLTAVTELEARQFHRLFVLGFGIFLVIVLVSRVLPDKWRPWSLEMAPGSKSIIDEALAAANTFIPFAFMR